MPRILQAIHINRTSSQVRGQNSPGGRGPISAIVCGGVGMSLWWLSYKGGTTFIVQAETLVHARLLAAADKVARAYLFDAGFRVDPEFEQFIPDDLIGRTLSGDEAAELQRRLRGDARYSRGR
jgi:hypothetical protein